MTICLRFYGILINKDTCWYAQTLELHFLGNVWGQKAEILAMSTKTMLQWSGQVFP